MRSPAEERGKRFGERVEGIDKILAQAAAKGTEIHGCVFGRTHRNSVRRDDGRHLTVVNICLQLPKASRKIAWRASKTASNVSDHLHTGSLSLRRVTSVVTDRTPARHVSCIQRELVQVQALRNAVSATPRESTTTLSVTR